MSKQGLRIARQHAGGLPQFGSLADAERTLFARREHLIRRLRQAAASLPEVQLDYSPESLKRLEAWYFRLLSDSFDAVGIGREEFEQAVSMYLGEVLTKNITRVEWSVTQSVFAPGRYEIGVGRPRVFGLMLTGRTNLEMIPNNKRHQSMWRSFRLYAKVYGAATDPPGI
jgi:hypothetical protein